jgi:hypothetical protein
MTTSRPDAFTGGRFERDIIRIPAGAYSFFPLDTIINLRELLPARIEKLAALPSPAEFTVEGDLTVSDTAKLVAILRSSRVVPDAMRARCYR